MPLSVPSAQNNNQKHCIMSKRVLLFVLSSVLMTFCISAQDYAVKGSVWDFDTAEPISSAAVLVYQITGNDTTFYGGCSTDDNGSFIIGQLKAGNYVLYAKSDNHFNTSKSFTLSSENVKDLGKITMRAGKGDLDPAITAVVAKIVDYFPENVYVDLGLSVKWATCNVGANTPEEYGDYYAWGEVETKESYEPNNYKFVNGGSPVNDKNTLDIENDVAHKEWGGKWRMPSREEFDELIQNCTWTWTTQKGVNGFLVTSNKPGYTDRSIFLPAAGLRSLSELRLSGNIGFYWTTTPSEHFAESACFLYITPGFKSLYESAARNQAHTVRPVCP